jgi:hypothetical protein
MTTAQGVGFSGVLGVQASGTLVERFDADNGRCHADGGKVVVAHVDPEDRLVPTSSVLPDGGRPESYCWADGPGHIRVATHEYVDCRRPRATTVITDAARVRLLGKILGARRQGLIRCRGRREPKYG